LLFHYYFPQISLYRGLDAKALHTHLHCSTTIP
jgi:hypothetical protein